MKKLVVLFIVLACLTYVIVDNSRLSTIQSVLDSELDNVENYITERDKVTLDVSSVDVAWHLDHLLKVINGIHLSLENSDPAEYKYSWKFQRSLVFSLGRFPRGFAKSPESVFPPDDIKTSDLHAQLKDARLVLSNFSELDENKHFNHSLFGTLNRDRTLRFIEIHTRHHLRIVRDIIKQSIGDKE